MPKRAAPLIAAAALLALSACANLDEVARLHVAAADARLALPHVSADLYASCQRRSALVARIPSSQLPPGDLSLTHDCAPYQALAAHLAADQTVLLDYLDALAKLASGSSLSYTKTIDTDLSTISGLTSASPNSAALLADAQKASQAALGLTRVLADLTTRHYREREIRRLIRDADPAVQQLTAALRRIAVTDYGIMLSAERIYLDGYYSPMDQKDFAAREPLAHILVQRQYDTDIAQLEARRHAAADYALLLHEIGLVHARLAASADSSSAFAASLQHVSSDIDTLTDTASALRAEVT